MDEKGMLDRLWTIAQEIEDICDEMEPTPFILKTLRGCSWGLRQFVLVRGN